MHDPGGSNVAFRQIEEEVHAGGCGESVGEDAVLDASDKSSVRSSAWVISSRVVDSWLPSIQV